LPWYNDRNSRGLAKSNVCWLEKIFGGEFIMNFRLNYMKTFLLVFILSVFTLAVIIENVSATVKVSNLSEPIIENTDKVKGGEKGDDDKDKEKRKREKEEKKRSEKAAKMQARSDSDSSKSVSRSDVLREQSKSEVKRADSKRPAAASAAALSE